MRFLKRSCNATFLCLAVLAFPVVAQPQKLIIDADVGIDDAMAILLAAASPEIELLGITTTFGNASIENSTRNAHYLLSRVGLSVPVARGSSFPLVKPPEPPADFVHGANGLGNFNFELKPTPADSALSAAEFIIEQSKLFPGQITLVPVGRMTNIALALRLDPELPSRIKQVVLMGGAFRVPGNVTPVAEANIQGDPEAADIVFGADWQVVAIGLDVTTQITVGPDQLNNLEQANPKTGAFVKGFSAFYLDFYRSVGVTAGFYIHDPAAILYVLQPSLFTTEAAPVRVASQGIAAGQTIAAFPPQDTRPGHWAGVPPALIATDVDEGAAQALFLQRLESLKLY